MLNRPRAGRRQRGLSLVELMVGLAVGLLVVAAASMMMAGQLLENRRLLAGAQLQQDLRAAADIMTRDLRRASRLSDEPIGSANGAVDTLDTTVAAGWQGVALPNNLPAPVVLNSNTEVTFGYVPDRTGTLNPPFGFKWDSTAGTLKFNLGAGGYQDLTDANTIRVTNFVVVLSNAGATPISLPCAKPCPTSSPDPTACWPTYNVRWLDYTIQAESRADPAVKREIKGRVRVRTDPVTFASASQICPT